MSMCFGVCLHILLVVRSCGACLIARPLIRMQRPVVSRMLDVSMTIMVMRDSVTMLQASLCIL